MDRRAFVKTSGLAALASLQAISSAEANRSAAATPSKFLVLSFDGGGMRGYLTSLILQRLNTEVGILGTDNTGIDLYAGTSTGALISLGLAAGSSIDSVVELYENDGAQIFAPQTTQSVCVQSLPNFLQKYKSIVSLYQSQFDNIASPSIQTVVEGFIPGDPTLGSLPSKVLVTTFQLAADLTSGTSWNPLVIDNFEGSAAASTKVYDAALSTSAAPIYFPPYQHPVFGWCSDGGLFANNPAPQAVARVIQTGIPLSNISVLSIGTGIANASISVDASKRLCYGANKWVSLAASGATPKLPLLNCIMDGVASTNDFLCTQLLGEKQYLRINPVLTRSVSLDDYSPATMQMFRDVANALFASSTWVDIKTWLSENFTRQAAKRNVI